MGLNEVGLGPGKAAELHARKRVVSVVAHTEPGHLASLCAVRVCCAAAPGPCSWVPSSAALKYAPKRLRLRPLQAMQPPSTWASAAAPRRTLLAVGWPPVGVTVARAVRVSMVVRTVPRRFPRTVFWSHFGPGLCISF